MLAFQAAYQAALLKCQVLEGKDGLRNCGEGLIYFFRLDKKFSNLVFFHGFLQVNVKLDKRQDGSSLGGAFQSMPTVEDSSSSSDDVTA